MATLVRRLPALLAVAVFAFSCAFTCVRASQGSRASSDEEFGPVVRAYLGYLRNEQEVVDDRASRHEVSASYYRRNSNRIKALRQMAIRLARESSNDYLPELEAVAGNEFRILFGSTPPQISTLKAGDVLRNTFRYLGSDPASRFTFLPAWILTNRLSCRKSPFQNPPPAQKPHPKTPPAPAASLRNAA